MVINYKFNGTFFDYELEYQSFIDGVLSVFSKNYEIPLDKVRHLFDQEWIDSDKVYEVFKEDVEEHFKDKAYKAYMDWRFA